MENQESDALSFGRDFLFEKEKSCGFESHPLHQTLQCV
jgi:hypothetical protein